MPLEAPAQAPAARTEVTPATLAADAAASAPKDLNALLGHDSRAVKLDAGGKPIKVGAAAPAAPVVPAAAPAAPVVPAPAAVVPPVVPPAAAPVEGEGTLEFSKNWRVEAKDAKDAQFLLLKKQGKTTQEAYAEVYGTASAPASAPAAEPVRSEAPPAPNTADIDARITAAETALSTLAGQITTALDKEADTKTAFTLKDQQLEKRLELEKLRGERAAIVSQAEAAAVDARVAKYQAARVANTTRASEAFPALAVVTSPERALFNQRVEQLRGDADRSAIFNSPDWPWAIAAQLAVEHGWVKAVPGASPPAAAAAPAAPVPPAAAPARATAAELITPGDPGASSFVPTLESLRADANLADPKVLNQLLAGPTPKIARR